MFAPNATPHRHISFKINVSVRVPSDLMPIHRFRVLRASMIVTLARTRQIVLPATRMTSERFRTEDVLRSAGTTIAESQLPANA